MPMLTPVKKPLPFKRRILVKRSRKSYLAERGWVLTGSGADERWEGYYRTRFGSYKGKIEPGCYPPKFYVKDPPEGLAKHKHWACFTDLKNGGWRSVHFRILPKDIASGVIGIERILHEAFQLSHHLSQTTA
jgi:hypothetical protein